ncbi:MAG: hypothetical protein CL866_02665 [Cycloclasticus sp.]|nr:hypothetical protein [Cycloclasticus sp.]MBG95759.1 hypothetical protein [Cycloclasticus sp.]HAI96898.1 hypothetical protein [Methylococcaceae bacterium]|tara:strand:+ start:204 stop:458 length:255 start_codon:yes stop_codon:yes gene_type:complete
MLLICIALLMGQYVALVHSVEHPFHEVTQACDAYIALEQSKDGLVSDCSKHLTPVAQTSHQAYFANTLLAGTQALYSIRAPPSV